MKSITVHLGNRQTVVKLMARDSVLQGPGIIGDLIVCDENTCDLFDHQFRHRVVLAPGEQHKTWESVRAILETAVSAGLGRDSVFVGVGGGVVCDLAAFAASVFMRGCEVILVPTSLLAMVDASVGGKTGFDFENLKNMVGTFHPASEVRICTEVLESLSEREFMSGLAELIKHGFLVTGTLISRIQTLRSEILERDTGVLDELVMESIGVKANVVEEDFRETDARAFLNLGHTFGHALESVSGFSGWTHGEAVAWGIGRAMATGLATGDTDPSYAAMVTSVLFDFGYRLSAPGVNAADILEAIKHDKKKRAGVPRYVLQRSLGDTFLREVPESVIMDVLQSS